MTPKRINLALQGGGAHGAFTWGVLDAMLAGGDLQIEGVSGTSAGAMNAAVLVDGLERGGAGLARQRLKDFWHHIADDGRFSLLQRTMFDRAIGSWSLDHSPGFIWLDMMSRFFSPYDFNPLNINPLRDLVAEYIDFTIIQNAVHHPLFISATNVHTGRLRVFSQESITADVVMASACLPMVFQAVEIDGVPYWDGGYMANPALFPFFKSSTSEDILIIQINPVACDKTPKTARDIADRINEITFNASLVDEYRAINFVSRLIDSGVLPHGMGEGEYRKIKIHRIVATDYMEGLTESSKFNTEQDFFEHLHDAGQRAFRGFIKKNLPLIGVQSTVDLSQEVPAEWA